jgi:hypothetical protein
MESYGDDKPTGRDYAKHLVPLNLVKMITTESSTFAEAERQRLNFMSQTETAPGHETYPEIEK